MKSSAMKSFNGFQKVFGLIALVMILGWASAGRAQDIVRRAMAMGQSGEWNQAYSLLEPAMKDEAIRTSAQSWYVLGFVEKELYKQSPHHSAGDASRVGAVNHLQQAIQMGLSGSDLNMAREALDFLSRSYFRDAIDLIEGYTWGSEPDILELFGRYEAIQMMLHPSHSTTEQRADLHRYLGQAHAILLESMTGQNPSRELELFEAAVNHYVESLLHDPKNYASNYNLAITIYNHGVRQLKRINSETSMFELMEIQDACVGLFEQALAPMERAHEQQPNRLETLKGLMTIHYALSNPAESNRYKQAIEQIMKNR